MTSLIGMILPFIAIGLVFTASALLWARHKGQISEQEVGTESLDREGEA